MKEKTIAWLIQAYTALGLVTSLFALRSALAGEMHFAFLWLAISIIIDATDGPLARRFRSSEILPDFDSRKLDDIVDYFSYVVVPVVILVRANLLPSGGWGWALMPLVSSAYGFCQEKAKTPDGYFTGFPSYWNIVVLYLFLFQLNQGLCLLIVLAFSVLVFIPIKYIDPFKTKPLRRITAPFMVLWGLSILYIILLLPDQHPLLVRVSFLYPCYYFLASFWINLTGRTKS